MGEFKFPMKETLEVLDSIHSTEEFKCSDQFKVVAFASKKLMEDDGAKSEFIQMVNDEYDCEAYKFLSYNIAEQIVDLVTTIIPRQLNQTNSNINLEKTCLFETLLMHAEKQRLAEQNKRYIWSGRLNNSKNENDELYYKMEFENFYSTNLKDKKSKKLFEEYLAGICKGNSNGGVSASNEYVEDVSKIIVVNPQSASAVASRNIKRISSVME